MIDFRYHVVSIAAVFLALGVGIVLGTGAFGEEVPRLVREQLSDERRTNERLEDDLSAARDQLENDRRFAQRVRDRLLPGVLQNDNFVLITFDETSGDLEDGVRDSVELAGGEMAATLAFNAKLRLDSPEDVAALGDLLGSTAEVPAELTQELGEELGVRLSAAALEASAPDDAPGGATTGAATRALREFLDELTAEDYLSVRRVNEDEALPPDPVFVFAGGSSDDPPFPTEGLTVALTTGLAGGGFPVMVVESSDSAWGVTAEIRSDGAARPAVSTVDNADTPEGSIALVLGLDLAEQGEVHHLGIEAGADDVIPAFIP